MMRFLGAWWAFLVLALVAPADALAQGYRVRLDVRAQGASFRGVSLDSVLATQAVALTDGSLETADGFALRCPGTDPYCRFFRAGPVRRGGPLTATADIVAWGLGMPGLSLHGTTRFGADLGAADVWPGTRTHAELLEGYAEYATGPLSARAGRVQSFSRLGAIGYDGATVTGRLPRGGLEGTIYGGWGLARALAIPINSPVLDPLDQYQPARRQLVAGGNVGWNVPRAAVRISYQREVDRRSQYFISERAGIDGTFRPPIRGLFLSGGADYDLASDEMGSAEGTADFTRGPVNVSVGGRRYRPQFDLWTIWGAFSPVPYRAGTAAFRVRPIQRLSLSARGEIFRFEPTGAETGLASYEDSGWRWSVEATAAMRPDLDATAGYRREIGPGAASAGFDLSASYHPDEKFSLLLYGASLERPLEFRYDVSDVQSVGLRAEFRPTSRLALAVGGSRYSESRERPDAASFDWNQFRLDARVTFLFNSGADLARLPPAVPAAGANR